MLVCAVPIWRVSKSAPPCGSRCCIVRVSIPQNLSLTMWTVPDLGGSFRLHANICRSCARRRCMMCPPCRQTSSRFTSYYNKSPKNYSDRKDELEVRRMRPSLSSTKAFQAELFSDSSGECPSSVLSATAACSTEKTSHDAWYSSSFRFDLDHFVTLSTGSFRDVIVAKATSGNQVQVGSFAPRMRRNAGQPTPRRIC